VRGTETEICVVVKRVKERMGNAAWQLKFTDLKIIYVELIAWFNHSLQQLIKTGDTANIRQSMQQ